MNRIRCFMLISLFFILGSNNALAQGEFIYEKNITNSLECIFLNSFVRGQPSREEKLKALITKENRSTIETLLINWATSDYDEDDIINKSLAYGSTRALVFCPSTKNKKVLLEIAKSKDKNLRRIALRTLVNINTNEVIYPELIEIMEDNERYDDLDRMSILEWQIYKTKNLPKDSKQRKSSVATLKVFFKKESYDGNRLLLDKFLVNECPDYQNMPERKEWLKKMEKSAIAKHKKYGLKQKNEKIKK